jgi:hypothetical protein
MNPLDKLRQRTEPAIRVQHQRREVARSTKHYSDFGQIRSGYLRTRTEDDPDRFDELMERTTSVIGAFASVTTPDDLLRAGAACVVVEQQDECPKELWRPAWSELFDEAGEALCMPGLEPAKCSMLWRIGHLRTFGALPSTDMAASVRSPLDSVPFYVFVHAPVDDLVRVLSACTSTYQALTHEADTWIGANF